MIKRNDISGGKILLLLLGLLSASFISSKNAGITIVVSDSSFDRPAGAKTVKVSYSKSLTSVRKMKLCAVISVIISK
ncbi:hypothetical protein OKW21_004523 [Catalinimonas alkaloidigena]|uniref:hypothetical protein n=1 Tax=Catalinimonas alkaloidigena TaxID=1075417 RepID=UPI002404A3E8|nr:hypothetical protein [Catalinimonas alkaloidigena]MDF9799260.1 hypothetical protein [Catalinimonas alkaloidigena]